MLDGINKFLKGIFKKEEKKDYTMEIVRVSKPLQEEKTKKNMAIVKVTKLPQEDNKKRNMEIVNVNKISSQTRAQSEEFNFPNIRILSREEALNGSTIDLYPVPTEITERKRDEKFRINVTDNEQSQKLQIQTQKRKEVENKLTLLYENKVKIIVDEINKVAKTRNEKLEALYKWFLNNVFYWDNYPRGSNGIKTGAYYALEDNISYSYPYETQECAIVKGFSICAGISSAFKDIASRLGLDVEQISNNNHAWNMVYSESGPLYIDLAQAVRHFKSDTPENRLFNKKEPINQEKATKSYLMKIDEIYNLYSHNNGKINDDNYRKYYEEIAVLKGHSR